MLEALITSKTRIKLMLKFFLDSNSKGYLRGLESEFGESSNAIRLELNRFEAAGLLLSFSEGNRKIYHANQFHPLFRDISNLVRTYVGMDEIIERIINHLGQPQEVYLLGDLANGLDSSIVSLLIIAEEIDLEYLEQLCIKAQKMIKRNIRYVVFSKEEFMQRLPSYDKEKKLLIWKNTN
jgi:hypothetical protein